MVIHHRCLRDCRLQQMGCRRPERYRPPLRWRAARSSRCFAKSLSLNDDAKKLQMSAMKACFQIAECSFFLCKGTAFLRVNYTLMGIGLKKSAKKWWITYKIVNNLTLDGRKFLRLRYNVCHVSVSHWAFSVTYREISVSHWQASCSILSLAQ